MADITVTAGNVVRVDGATIDYLAGETITAGQTVYLSTAGTVLKADNNDTAAKASVLGIALNGGASGQPIRVQTGGTITIGATVAQGVIYCQSRTAGGICPSADLLATDYVTVIGVATTTAAIKLSILATGIQMA